MARDKISDLNIDKVSTAFKRDKEGDRFVETTITFKTQSLAPNQAARLQELGATGQVEITIAPQMAAVRSTAEA